MTFSESSWTSTLLASASSGLVGRILCHPFDTCKARLQAPLNFAGYNTVFNTFRRTVSEEGVKGLYRGIGAVLMGGIPGTCLYLSTYEVSKKYLSSVPIISSSPFSIYLTSGMTAETVCCIIFVPIDVIKNRMQLQKTIQGVHIPYPGQPIYRSSIDALFTITKEHGIKGLYKGYGATLLSFGPFSAIYFLLYEEVDG